jgi:hypothetical protein
VIAGNNYLRTVNLPANALVWNPIQQVIYAAVPASANSNASSIVAIDPASGNVVASQPMPAEPSLLAISEDQQYLYAGIDGDPQVSSTAGPVYGGPTLIRWGSAGLAFNAGNSIYILDGPFVTPGTPPSSNAGTYIDFPPQLTGLIPESVVAGSPDVTLTLTGQNFTPATSVSWLNNTLATTFVSNTEVQAVIPAAAITARFRLSCLAIASGRPARRNLRR